MKKNIDRTLVVKNILANMRVLAILVAYLTVLGVEEVWGVNWNKIDNLSDITSGDSVLVVMQDGKTTTSGKAFTITGTTSANSTDVAITSNSYISNPANNIKWAMSVSNSVYTFKNGTAYLQTGSADNNNVGTGTTSSSWYITKLSDGYFKVQLSDKDGRYIAWKGSCFGKYATSNFANQISSSAALAQYHGAISFYKKETGYAVTYNNGGHGTAPTSPTAATSLTLAAITGVEGYTNSYWTANVAVTNTSTSASIAAGTSIANGTNVTLSQATTFTAQWSANQYTVTLNDNTGSGGSGSKTVTYNANTNLTTSVAVPTKAHHDFAGYWTSTDNGATFGTKLVNADGSWVASVTNYTDASKNWIKADNVTLYAKWTEHSLTNYRTSCCTELGTIDGEATLTQGGNSVTISGWSDVSNVGTYTVKLYKKNGASWDLVSGTASGGSAGAQGTRTGITSGSKSVTYTGLEVESEYKFTVQAIAGSAAYCDGVETAVTEINHIDVSSSPFKFRYSIYIDNGSGSGWAHHYIEPTGNTDEGSVSITLGAHVTSYQFKIFGGFAGDWGQTGSDGVIPANTKWTLNGSYNVKLNTGAGGAYVFTVDYSGTTNPGVTVTFPSADQAADYKIYFDKSAVADWGATLKYRIGNGSHNQNQNFTLVPGTDQFYVTTTPSYGSMDAWQIANNVAWSGSNSIYNYYHADDATNITRATVFQDYAVDEDITIVPTSVHNTENSCQFWDVSKTSGMLTHTATITTPSHGTINIAYTDVSGTSQPTNTSTVADLAHRTILTITATPATGYTCTSLTVNGAAFTSGSTHILAADATIAATFTAQTSTVTLDNNSATSGSQQTVTATYDATMPLKTTADGTPAVAALTRTGYTFNGWWDNTSGGNQYYTYSGSPKVIASARTWDKTGAQTLKAQWIVNQYTLTWDLQGGTVATAGTGAAAAATGTPSSSQDYGTGLTAPIVTKTGYNFNVWSPSVAGTMPAANTTYTASWTAQVYNITYKDQGDNAYSGNATAGVPTGAPTTHTYGSATALVNGVKDGYRFDGWFTDASCTVSAGSSIGATAKTADFTLYAKWTQVYTVTWHVNGSEYEAGVVPGNSAVVSGGKISEMPTAPSNSTLSACANKFMGWSKKDAGATAKTTSYYDDLFTTVAGSPTISAATDFYAVFAEVTEDKYWSMGTIDKLGSGTGYAAYDGTHTVTGSDGNSYTYESSYVMSNSGNQFKASSDCGRIYNTSSLGNINRIVLNYSAYKGQMKVYESDSQISSSGTTALTETVSGEDNEIYTYECSGKGYFIVIQEGSNAAKADVTVYFGSSASNYRTQCDANMIRVTYDANGGMTGCENETTDKREDYTVCSSAPTRDYYTFAGWLCSADDEVYAASATISAAAIDADFTLTAQWTPVTYTITYNYNGGSAQEDPVPATSYTVESSDITLQTPTYGHNRFEGWYENADLSTGGVKTTIAAGSHENKTYYAKWATRHHIEFFKEGSSVGEIWRADDEDISASVAGQGTAPGNQTAPSACSSKVFMGWSESTIDGETDDEPADLMKPAAGTVDEDKHYYAVWATVTPTDPPATYAGTGVFEEITSMEDFETGTYYVLYGYDGESTHGALKNAGSGTAGEEAGTNMTVSTSSITNPSTDIVWKLGGTTDAYTLYNQSASKYIEITTDDAKGFALNASAATSYKVTVEDGHGFFFKTNKTGCTRGISIYTSTSFRCYALANAKNLRLFKLPTNTVTAYCTSCCATKVTLSENSPEHGTIVFGKTSVGTCGGDKEVSLTITPAAGYQLHSYEVATGSGKVAAKSVSPDIALDNNSSAEQNITLTFAEDANGAYDVTASFTKMAPTAWTWTYKSEAIPNPINLYVGQTATLNATYTPSGLLNSEQNYDVTKSANLTQTSKTYASPDIHYTFRADAAMDDGTVTLTNQINTSLTTTVHVHVDPLPRVHFEDLVHGKEFADVVATLSENALNPNKTTKTSVDWTTPNANDCESDHLHLVGWIREDWPALVAYLNGTGDAPSTTEIVGAGNDGSGNAYFFAPNASINVLTFNGATFYAVWAEIK